MESPVMTSASSHRLRSAVSACAQPTHSYLSSSYLNASVQVESHNSGGCFNNFSHSRKKNEDSLLSVPKEPHSSNNLPLHKRHKTGNKHGSRYQNAKKNEKEVANSSSNDVLTLIPKQVMLGNDFLSKLKFSGKVLESKRLADYLDKAPRNGNKTVSINCEKAISGNCNKKNSFNSNINNNNKVLNHRDNYCNEGKSKKSISGGRKDSINEKSEHSDEWSECGVVHLNGGIKNEKLELSKWQPKHVVTRRTAQIVREIRNAWQNSAEFSSVPPERIGALFNDFQRFLPVSKVREMLEYARERPVEPSGKPITFGDFSRVANDLSRSSSLPRILDKNVEKRGRKFSKGMNKYEVFLGGSCNPTTWRTDYAIPELKRMGISYYNPQQVDEWRPELMEVEYHAKENATVMFFVLDNQTRGVSALIEVAHLAGNRRKLILVIQSYTQKNQMICDEKISKEEYEDLKKGQEVLQVLVERQGIPVFSNIKVALESTEKILRENLQVQDLQASVHVNREISIEEVFEKLDSKKSGEISADDVCLALKTLTGIGVSAVDLRDFISKAGKEVNGTLLGDVKFDFELFSKLVAEFKRGLKGVTPLDSFPLSGFCCRDIYLGGTIENTLWRESIAIPELEKVNLSYYVPKISEAGSPFTEIEAAAMDNSFIVLFVITNTARSIAAMAIAGHYIGKGANVVLCVEHLPENTVLGNEKLSENAVKDYNRGRMYLMDIAERSGVRVLDDILTAVKFVIQKCKSR